MTTVSFGLYAVGQTMVAGMSVRGGAPGLDQTRPDRDRGLDEMKKAPRLRGLVAKLPVQQQAYFLTNLSCLCSSE